MLQITQQALIAVLDSKNTIEFERITSSPPVGPIDIYKLTLFAEAFPDQRQQLFDFIINPPWVFDQITRATRYRAKVDNIRILAQEFPDKCQQLFELITSAPEEFQEMIKTRFSYKC